MVSSSRVMFIDYEEAQRLLPIFKDLKRYPDREIKVLAGEIYRELELVKDMDYEPLGGKQVFLSRKEKELFDSVTGVIG